MNELGLDVLYIYWSNTGQIVSLGFNNKLQIDLIYKTELETIMESPNM